MRLLLLTGVDIDIKNLYGLTSLHRAARDGHVELVRLLLTAGADTNARTDDQADCETALHFAVANGHLEIVRMLLVAGVDIDPTAVNLANGQPEPHIKRLLRQVLVFQKPGFKVMFCFLNGKSGIYTGWCPPSYKLVYKPH